MDVIKESLLYEKLKEEKVRCNTCERKCIIPKEKTGFCKTRKNEDGKLYTLVYGDVGLFTDANPIEKKPFFNFWPGSYALTVGTWSCNFGCVWCQNFHMSATPPNPQESNYISPERFIELVKLYNCQGTSISFNEPTLLFEYSLDVFKLARKEGFYNTYVTNGYMTLDALKLLKKAGLDAMNVDVKGDEEAVKKYCGGVDVKKVWRNIETAKKLGIHVEITTLVIPGVNEDEGCLKEIAGKIRKIDKNIPWHVTQYYPAYKALDYGLYPGRTPVETLEKAYRIGKESGLNYVYAGNVPGHKYENTYCHNCNEMLIERFGFDVVTYKVTKDNRCPVCKEKIPIVGSGGVSKEHAFF
ncbi:MAG: AmmeMemoRadiSam system radical SAM enzyme [Candidatus Aenigmarchaeota archaeon]|nr:AmmeMemoRadiSam system radical SAM enzyme [Candidatus Aenigmarchaeota archaeon]